MSTPEIDAQWLGWDAINGRVRSIWELCAHASHDDLVAALNCVAACRARDLIMEACEHGHVEWLEDLLDEIPDDELASILLTNEDRASDCAIGVMLWRSETWRVLFHRLGATQDKGARLLGGTIGDVSGGLVHLVVEGRICRDEKDVNRLISDMSRILGDSVTAKLITARDRASRTPWQRAESSGAPPDVVAALKRAEIRYRAGQMRSAVAEQGYAI